MLMGATMLLAVLPCVFSMPLVFTVVEFGSLALSAMMGVILVSASPRMDVGQVRCLWLGQALQIHFNF
jgi:hypothetical protein